MVSVQILPDRADISNTYRLSTKCNQIINFGFNYIVMFLKQHLKQPMVRLEYHETKIKTLSESMFRSFGLSRRLPSTTPHRFTQTFISNVNSLAT